MNNKKATLSEFLTHELRKQGFQPDDQQIKILVEAVSLQEGQSNEADETRSVRINEDTDGQVTAKRFSLYNLMEIRYYEYFEFGLEAGLLFADNKPNKLQIALGLLLLLNSFHQKMSSEFNETDAKILLAIFHLDERSITESEVLQTYHKHFDQDLTPERLSRSMRYFEDIRILKKEEEKGSYRVRERMTYERK